MTNKLQSYFSEMKDRLNALKEDIQSKMSDSSIDTAEHNLKEEYNKLNADIEEEIRKNDPNLSNNHDESKIEEIKNEAEARFNELKDRLNNIGNDNNH